MANVFNMVGGGGGGIKLASISITTPPAKTTYTAGETFDPAGMVVTATYSNGATAIATGYTFTPSTGLTDGTTEVTIQYTEAGVTKTATQAVTVVHRLESIAVTTQPTKTTYEYGDTFSSSGMVVTATYSDGATAAVTGYTTSPSALSTVGTQTITVSHTEGSVTKTATLSVTVERKTLTSVPSQSGSLTYTGSAQSPSWSNYDSAQLTIGGVTSGTNAGSYNATFTPTANYRWSDGTTTAKTASWTIGKAAGSLSLSADTLSLYATTTSGTITVTRAGDGAISASSNATGVAKVSVSGNKVTITGVASGSATITVNVGEGTNYTAPSSKTVAVTVQFLPAVGTPLNDMSWSDIKKISDAGQASNYWAVGDTKTITINGKMGATPLSNLSIDVFILGFDHNSSVEGSGKIHFQIGKLSGKMVGLIDSSYNNISSASGKFTMNKSSTNSGGWASSHMRKTVLGSDSSPTSPTENTLLSALPSDLRAVMKAVTKYTDNTANGGGNTSSFVTATTDYLFLLAEFEVQGARSYANSYEKNYQAQYAYYSSGNSKVAYRHSATGSTAWWWLRSPRYNDSTRFCHVDTDGSAHVNHAHISAAVLPGFAV